MWCYRRVLRVSWTDHRTNEWVLSRLEVEKSLLARIRTLKLSYYGHIMRKVNCLDKDIMGCVPGSRGRGRPRRRWREDISDWTGLRINDAARSAEDRDSRRRVIRAANPSTGGWQQTTTAHSMLFKECVSFRIAHGCSADSAATSWYEIGLPAMFVVLNVDALQMMMVMMMMMMSFCCCQRRRALHGAHVGCGSWTRSGDEDPARQSRQRQRSRQNEGLPLSGVTRGDRPG